jgi:hypothetical protein
MPEKNSVFCFHPLSIRVGERGTTSAFHSSTKIFVECLLLFFFPFFFFFFLTCPHKKENVDSS